MAARDIVARHSDYDETRDFIPTPPFVTRALFEHVAPDMKEGTYYKTIWDPAAGEGHMLKVFNEYDFGSVKGTDIQPFIGPLGAVGEADFMLPVSDKTVDYIVTNPPYKHLESFILKALARANQGVAMLMRVQALEGQTRYRKIWNFVPPTQVAFFSDRIPFKVGRVVRKAPKMFFHVWVYWDLMHPGICRAPLWIPPNVQQRLEKDSDYEG